MLFNGRTPRLFGFSGIRRLGKVFPPARVHLSLQNPTRFHFDSCNFLAYQSIGGPFNPNNRDQYDPGEGGIDWSQPEPQHIEDRLFLEYQSFLENFQEGVRSFALLI